MLNFAQRNSVNCIICFISNAKLYTDVTSGNKKELIDKFCVCQKLCNCRGMKSWYILSGNKESNNC